ncbi:Holliday junction branch migration protein RuvA [Candidatus Parcubacteria bacterium]|nr:MAG: Holliday junction branch migration protein RuvA [Candidatus Parcubacteria bacterium]
MKFYPETNARRFFKRLVFLSRKVFFDKMVLMIAYLRGKIRYIKPLSKKDNYFIIDVGGIGYLVFCPAQLADKLKIGEEKEIYTAQIIREDSHELYGFEKQSETDFFKLLIGVSGIGPKKSLAILEQARLADILKAIVSDKPEFLVKVSGLSKNVAEKIVIGLQEKVKNLSAKDFGKIQDMPDDSDSMEALLALGFSLPQAKEALAEVSSDISDKDKRIKAALKILGNNR